VVVGAFHRASWKALCTALGREDLAADPRFKDNWDRVKNRKALIYILSAEIVRRTRDEWLKVFNDDQVLSAPVLSIKESLGTFEKLIDGLVVTTDHSKLGKLKEVRCPIIFDGQPASQTRAAPTLGEHTVERLKKSGYSDADLERWRQERII
jgi:crotonobetainyl-CoA:carnitine CoA-transferase CaiB-like acyl-CoA transferase